MNLQKLGRSVSRECGVVPRTINVIARSTCDEAIQFFPFVALDCFANARNDDVRRTSIISDFQKLSLTPDPNQLLILRHPVPREGALAIVTDVGAGSDGRESCD